MKKTILLLLLLTLTVFTKDYTKNRETRAFINELSKTYGMKKKDLNRLFSNVKVQKSALRAFLPRKQQTRIKETRTPEQIAKAKKLREKYGTWERYARRTVTSKRVKDGVAFLKKYKTTLQKVEKKYGVPKEIIVAIIGIETAYGANVGKYPVFDTLTTLAFEKNRRNKFFKNQLKHFIHLSQREKFNPKNVYGSYAGAIGLGQFMPSNYAAYGIDFNGDGKITLQRKPDAIASIANYFKKNGWRTGEPVATRVSYKGKRFKAYKTGYKTSYHRKELKGIAPKKFWNYQGKVRLIKLHKKQYDELWYGAKNFYVITRYNHSSYYAMAVYQLATKIEEKIKG
ncbi:MAG: lytic murein transglycosylase B [Campylobacterota bacterium]|nr:lytic murein transglycosylase B [Campylobacterota bacterium]